MSQPADTAGVRPFSTGSQAGDWLGRNCVVCAHSTPDQAGDCPMENALGLAMLGSGQMPEPLALRMGYDPQTQPANLYSWECPEKVDRRA